MYKIGEFSTLAKTTIKTLRYYEKEKLLILSFVDSNGYRYYDAIQLLDLAKIISLRQIGLSIEGIKQVLDGKDLNKVLNIRKKVVENELNEYKYQFYKINYILEERDMKYEVITKELPEYVVYYKEGIIKDFSEISNFILSSANECMKSKYNYEEIEKILSDNNLLIYEHLNNVEMTNTYFKNYNMFNPDNKIKVPKGVNYCLAVKKRLLFDFMV